MKIALLHVAFDRSGGAERSALALANGLAARGHEVHAFGRRRDGLDARAIFHRVPVVPAGRILKTWSFAWSAASGVRRERFDIVQGFGRTTCQTVHRASGGFHRSYLHETGRTRFSAYDRLVVALEDRLFTSERLRAVICPSAWVGREIATYYPGAAPKARVVTNGVDTTEFRLDGREADRRAVRLAMGVPAEAPLLLFVGTGFRRKGLETAISALPMLTAAHLVVVGDGRKRPLRVLAETLGVASRVHVAGHQAMVAPWYRAADVLVHPTRYDPFANVCLEAAACGTPIVTTDHDGAGEVIAGTGAGIVLGCPVVPAALARAVSELLDGGQEARDAARRLAERHTLDAHVGEVERLYRGTIARIDEA